MAIAIVGSEIGPGAGVAEASSALGSGGELHTITPQRVLDTRPASRVNDRDRPGRKQISTNASHRFDVQILGNPGLPSVANRSSVLGVLASVTVVDPTTNGYIRAWPTGSPEPPSSIVNFRSREVVPNLTVLTPGPDGRVSLRMHSGVAGTADVLIDVFGWISSSSHAQSGARLIPAGPGRIYDSRESRFGGSPIGRDQTIELQIRGANSVSPVINSIVPNSPDVNGVLVNITAVNTTAQSSGTFVSALPERPRGRPSTSNLNLTAGQVKANLALVPIGADGRIRLFNANGAVHLVVDVIGYLQPRPTATRVGRVVPMAEHVRVLDTREAAFGRAPLGPGMAEDWSFADVVVSANIRGTSLGNQMGFLGNLTATGLRPQRNWFGPISSYLSVYPQPSGTGAPPTISNLNTTGGLDVPNLALFRYGTGQQANRVRVYNFNGEQHYVVDLIAVILDE